MFALFSASSSLISFSSLEGKSVWGLSKGELVGIFVGILDWSPLHFEFSYSNPSKHLSQVEPSLHVSQLSIHL